jgi:hypothetical protein
MVAPGSFVDIGGGAISAIIGLVILAVIVLLVLGGGELPAINCQEPYS